MHDNNALVPEHIQLDAEPIQELENQVVNAAEDADREVGSLLGSSGWNRISKEMKADVDKLRNMKGVDLAGKDFAEVGQKFLVASLVADHLQKYLDKVDNAAKAVANAERAKQPN